MDERNLGNVSPKPTTAQTEGIISSVEFPALTKEDLEEIEDLYYKLQKSFSGEIPGLELFTGTGENVGKGNIIYNSFMTLHQFYYALAITRHSLIKEIAKPEFDRSNFDAKVLVESKILAGIKILDLGCGINPVFARCCRALGADVWTVDLRPAKDFYFKEELFSKEQRDLGIQKHIQIDLSNGLAPRIIK